MERTRRLTGTEGDSGALVGLLLCLEFDVRRGMAGCGSPAGLFTSGLSASWRSAALGSDFGFRYWPCMNVGSGSSTGCLQPGSAHQGSRLLWAVNWLSLIVGSRLLGSELAFVGCGKPAALGSEC